MNLYRSLTIIFLFFIFCDGFSQSHTETAYLLFDTSSDETCKIDTEGKEEQYLNKFRKTDMETFILFYICEEKFVFDKVSGVKDVFSAEVLHSINIVDLKYLLKKYEQSDPKQFKHHVFDKIYIIEEKSEYQYEAYKVVWNDMSLGVIE